MFKVWWEILYKLCCKLCSLSTGDRIVKLGWQLTELSIWDWCTTFWNTVYIFEIKFAIDTQKTSVYVASNRMCIYGNCIYVWSVCPRFFFSAKDVSYHNIYHNCVIYRKMRSKWDRMWDGVEQQRTQIILRSDIRSTRHQLFQSSVQVGMTFTVIHRIRYI